MQITSFQKMLLGVGATVGVVGGGAGLLVARHHRKQAEEATYRATPVPVSEFVDRTIDAFDDRTYGDPLKPGPADRDDTKDGVLHVGIEDLVDRDHQFYPEITQADAGGDNGYYDRVDGRGFLRAADADKDGAVTREELTAAVKPFAGDDGKLDEAERRKVLIEGKLGVIVDTSTPDRPDIVGWDSGSVSTAWSAASVVLRAYMPHGSKLEDGGSPAVRISDVEAKVPWTDWQEKNLLGTGPITSARPALARIDDEFGNGNGLVSQGEVAKWIAQTYQDDELLPGHVKQDHDVWAAAVEPTELGRVDATKLSGALYVNDEVPTATVDRFFGGSIPAYVDDIPGFTTARGQAQWQPDADDAP